jgi:D-glycero-alpha-D-manno-heptose 1-phosphate guanylyltransferase
VAGRPFLYWVTSWLIGQGVSDIVYSAGHLGEQIETWVAGLRMIEGVGALCRRERSPLGTGGAVLACLEDCQDLILVANGDTLLLANLEPLVLRVRADRLDGLVVGVPMADTSRFGSLKVGEDGMLQSFREKQPGAGVVNGGLYLFQRALLRRFLPVHRVSLELDLLPELLSSGARIGVAVLERPFLDIGVPKTFAIATDFVTANRAQLADWGA